MDIEDEAERITVIGQMNNICLPYAKSHTSQTVFKRPDDQKVTGISMDPDGFC